MTAEGVKGLFIRRRASFVVWALRRVALSRRTWRGFGGFGGRVVGVSVVVFGEREVRNWVISARWVCARRTSVCEEAIATREVVVCVMSAEREGRNNLSLMPRETFTQPGVSR